MDCRLLEEAIRTVTHLGVFFEELKQRAEQLAIRVPITQRGYFTPAEEHETQALLHSYHQARKALFEVIQAVRDQQADASLENESAGDKVLETRLGQSSFVTAYAAALLLVDGARFLREKVHHHGPIRRKLNDGCPDLEIPPNLYETVQESLVSARNAWHLYHAINYFEDNEPALRELCLEGDSLRPILEIIDRLQHRLEVSIGQFAKARMRTRADRVLSRLHRDLLHRAMYGLQKLSGTLLANKYLRWGHQPQMPAIITKALRTSLQPGDILVVRKEYALTNYFLPGFWPHAALYLGDARTLAQLGLESHEHVQPHWRQLLQPADNDPQRVLESMKDGVLIRGLQSPFASDSILVIRPDLPMVRRAEALAAGLSHEGKRYDFDFDFSRSDRLVCTEVIYRAYCDCGALNLPLKIRAGRPTLSGSDLVDLSLSENSGLLPVAIYAPTVNPEIVEGQKVADLVRTCMG